jgi:PleD family two-component response regulator
MEGRLHAGLFAALPSCARSQASKGRAWAFGSSLSRSPSCGRINDRPVRVLVVDDHPAVRAEVENVLRADAELTVVGSAATASDAISQALVHVPTLAIVDYQLPDRDGLSLTLELKRV